MSSYEDELDDVVANEAQVAKLLEKPEAVEVLESAWAVLKALGLDTAKGLVADGAAIEPMAAKLAAGAIKGFVAGKLGL